MAAETLKKGKGFVSLGGVYADPDDVDAARISKLIRSTMTRLHVDINRSVAYYRTTLGGAPPKRVFLTGGSRSFPISIFSSPTSSACPSPISIRCATSTLAPR